MLAYLRPLADLQNQRAVLLGAGIDDRLGQLHVVDIERPDGKPAIISKVKHRLSGHQRHKTAILSRNLRKSPVSKPGVYENRPGSPTFCRKLERQPAATQGASTRGAFSTRAIFRRPLRTPRGARTLGSSITPTRASFPFTSRCNHMFLPATPFSSAGSKTHVRSRALFRACRSFLMSAFSRPVASVGVSDPIRNPLREVARRHRVVVAGVGVLRTLTFGLMALLMGALLLGYFEGMPGFCACHWRSRPGV